MLNNAFFNRDACTVAKDLLGKIIYRKLNNVWLKVRIIETEAYYITEKASHSSLGYTEKRKAMFMPAGTIYMYYCRGRDTLNISVKGKGNAVLIKSGYPYKITKKMIKLMQQQYSNDQDRPVARLCNGQTLLCQALGLKVKDWDQETFAENTFYITDEKIKVINIIESSRIGIAKGRDDHLLYRFIDQDYVRFCTKPVSIK